MVQKKANARPDQRNDADPRPRRIDYRIFDLYREMTKSEKRLADVILEYEGRFSSYSAAELARRSNVSKATAVRFFRHLGYQSYDDAINQSRGFPYWGSPLYDDSSVLANGNGAVGHDTKGDLENHIRRDIENLMQLLDWLDENLVDLATDHLCKAKTVWIIGFRNSFALAQYVRGVLSNMRKNVRLFPTHAFDIAETLASISKSDVIFAIGFRRRPKTLYPILEHANKRGIPIILVADKTASKTASISDVVLRCQNRGSAMFDSYVAGISLLNYLVTNVAAKLGAKAKKHIAIVEEIHDDLHDLI